METLADLKSLFNDIFPESKGKEKTPVILSEFFHKLITSNPKDLLLKIIHLFFYPSKSSRAQNTDKNFWFDSFKNSEIYTEYNLALDVLKILKKYLANKNSDAAYREIKELPEKFGNYKNVDLFMIMTYGFIEERDILIHLYSFFHQDPSYFQNFFDIIIKEGEDLSDPLLLEKLFVGKTISKNELFLYKTYSKKINDQNRNVKELTENVKILNQHKVESENQIKDISEKLNQIYLKDTLKYTIKYIYRLFHQKFNHDEQFQSNVYDEIRELKLILKKQEFSKYDYLLEFISAIEFGDLIMVNKVSRPSLQNSNFEIIKKYVDNNKPYLDKVLKFLEKLPDLAKYINLEIDYYFSKELLEKKIQENYDFTKIYDDVIIK